MNARKTNKSRKVPNVKLRPPPPSSSTGSRRSNPRSYPSSLASNPLALPSQEESDATFVDTCPRPFQGVVVCATGISDKTTLFKQALELGAGHHNHFTDRVTHLIADEHGGAKYKCAVQMKLPIVRSSWITECHEIWLRGDDVNFEESLAEHRLPIFSDLVLASSGIESPERRMEIKKLATEQMGTYVKNIERPVKVTHLLCSGDEVTEKMTYAQKFNQRGEAEIKLVWEEWFWDCLSFGGRLGEEDYLVSGPRPEPKSSQSNLQRSSSPQIHQHSSHPTPPPESSSEPPQEVVAAPDPEGEEEIASVKRVPHVTLQLWENLLGSRGFEIMDGKLKRSPTKVKSLEVAAVDDDIPLPIPKPPNVMEGASMLSNFKRTNSFAPANKDSSTQHLPRRQPFTKGDSFLVNPPPPSMQPVASGSGDNSTMEGRKNFFQGKRFRALGEARCLNVKTVVESGGGSWIVEDDEDVDFVVVRLVSGSKLFRDEYDQTERAKFRTECWLEWCNYEERVCDPDEHVTFRPLAIQTPVRGAEDINLSFSGLDQSEACWLRRFVRAIGANLAHNFSRQSTHLLCPSFNGAKYDKANEWGVPVVDMAWLEDVAKTGALPSSTKPPIDEELPRPEDTENSGKEGRVVHETTIVDVVDGSQLAQSQQHEQFKPNGLLLNNESDISFGRSSMFLGHSTPKRGLRPNESSPPRQERSQAQAPGSSLAGSPATKDFERIPSSTSPSPLKIQGSPVKNTQLDEQATKKLQETIVNLLGKRRSSTEEIENVAQQGRVAKRTRPMSRTKSSSKTGPGDDDVFVFDAQGCVNGGVFGPSRVQDDGDDGLGGMPEGENRQKEEGLRVVYEDPRQRDEKKRLMTLLGSVPPVKEMEQPATKKVGLVRRSTRIAGF